MKGADYVAVETLYDKAGRVVAAPGASCERVPQTSLEWLERDGLIVRATPPTGGFVPATPGGREMRMAGDAGEHMVPEPGRRSPSPKGKE